MGKVGKFPRVYPLIFSWKRGKSLVVINSDSIVDCAYIGVVQWSGAQNKTLLPYNGTPSDHRALDEGHLTILLELSPNNFF